MLHGKKIVLGVTGGIAAYKCATLVRLLVKQGADVRVILTKAATDFITPQTLSVLSKNEVLLDFFDKDFNWNNHVHLAEWADVLLIAPLTANTLSKMANGACDNILLATYLSAKSKTIVAPAMDLDMYKHPSVIKNLSTLKGYGNEIIPAESGELASGLVGEGRMAEPENIVSYLEDFFSKGLPLKGKKALVNAGPTYEPIDPVRFIGNRSSGKMGVALAEELAAKGAEVTLVLGPSHVSITNKSIKLIKVETGDQMYDATLSGFELSDIVICSAAVADYKAVNKSESKLKKQKGAKAGDRINLELEITKDILAELGRRKKQQLLIGFALETDNLLEYAKDKLKAKNLDLVVANWANEKGAGFASDTNKVSLIDKHNKITNFELKAKQAVAADIVNHILEMIK
ncbi:MAG: bifunctional phosphopantothenoylcysteine decarboxylase/phosphopantothenate--cysteine ligase CoaBC [Bacteroidia bacterium]|nr:bifunctional phosphopantothenoylcysteine decarboxylase/phosphopantothenate--cysteine ligase CoaBC [Bacteroidia bacterium]